MAAHENLSNQFGYQGSHTPYAGENDVRFHELDKAMPNFYATPHHYIHDHKNNDFYGAREATRSAKSAQGKPEAPVTIYRAVPGTAETINPGDWVTTSRKYAEHHAKSNLPEGAQGKVIRAVTQAKHVTFGGNDAYEFGYAGTEPLKHMESE